MSSLTIRQWTDNAMLSLMVLAVVSLLSSISACAFFSGLALLGTEGVSGYALTAAAVVIASAIVYRLVALYFAHTEPNPTERNEANGQQRAPENPPSFVNDDGEVSQEWLDSYTQRAKALMDKTTVSRPLDG